MWLANGIGYKEMPLKITGRWKITHNKDGEVLMSIEAKGWIFKYWVEEHDIAFYFEETEEIFDNCVDN